MIVLLIVIAVIAILLAVPIRAEIYFEYSAGGTSFTAGVKLLGIRLHMPRIKRTEPKTDSDDEPEKEDQGGNSRIATAIGFIRENFTEIKELVYDILEYMRRHLIKIQKLTLSTVIGVPDAMETALLYGAEAAFVYNIVGVMDRHMRLVSHDIDLRTDYNEPRLYVQFTSDIRTNVYHMFAVTVIILRRALPLLKKMRKTIG